MAHGMNGYTALEFDTTPYGSRELSGEDEWETHGATGYAATETLNEDEWESPEGHPYAVQEALGEEEWGAQESLETLGEGAWEDEGGHEASPFASPEDEADPFLPLLGFAAAKALPFIARAVLPAAKKLLPHAARLAGQVARNVLGGADPGPMPPRRAPNAARPRPGRPRVARQYSGIAAQPASMGQSPLLADLLRQLVTVLGQGNQEAAAMEAEWFGANEFQGELATHESAQEAALTEVLAAEASHAESLAEAAALLGAALPITIRIMGGQRSLRRVAPTLVRANSRLIRGLHTAGPPGRALLRVVPALQRRTVASLRVAAQQGWAITPGLVSRVMAGHAARLLGTPSVAGPALVRNAVIRRRTVAPVGRRIRPGYGTYR